MFKAKQRYQINNQHSVNNGKFLTIVKVEGEKIYFIYDGYSTIYYFNIYSDFVYDMIPIH